MARGAVVEGKRLEWLEEPIELGSRLFGGATLGYSKQQLSFHH
jgi:hypothetical protein